MRTVHRAELRDSWPAWLGVSLGFIAANFTIALTSMVINTGYANIEEGDLATQHSAAYTIGAAMNLLFCIVVSTSVIGASTGLVVNSRRGNLARLALAGATPRQVVSTVMRQLAAVTLGCALIGDVLALALLQPWLNTLGAERASQGGTALAAEYDLWPLLLANLLTVGVALLAGRKHAVAASRIPAIEALREATGIQHDRVGVWGWVRAALCLAVVVAVYASLPAVTAVRTKETLSNISVASMGVLVFTGAFLALIMPVVVGPVTRAWTRLVPSRDPMWQLARLTVVARAARFSRTVVPVMLSIGLGWGMVALGSSFMASAEANLNLGEMSGGQGVLGFVVFLGQPSLIAMAGGVGSLIMMSKQRAAELALTGIAGATPAQRRSLSMLEGVIIAVTGTVLGLVMVLVAVGVLAVGFPMVPFEFVADFAWPLAALLAGVCAVTVVATTVVPTLSTITEPEPKVVARLVAE